MVSTRKKRKLTPEQLIEKDRIHRRIYWGNATEEEKRKYEELSGNPASKIKLYVRKCRDDRDRKKNRLRMAIRRGRDTEEIRKAYKELTGNDASTVPLETKAKKEARLEYNRIESRKRLKALHEDGSEESKKKLEYKREYVILYQRLRYGKRTERDKRAWKKLTGKDASTVKPETKAEKEARLQKNRNKYRQLSKLARLIEEVESDDSEAIQRLAKDERQRKKPTRKDASSVKPATLAVKEVKSNSDQKRRRKPARQKEEESDDSEAIKRSEKERKKLGRTAASSRTPVTPATKEAHRERNLEGRRPRKPVRHKKEESSDSEAIDSDEEESCEEESEEESKHEYNVEEEENRKEMQPARRRTNRKRRRPSRQWQEQEESDDIEANLFADGEESSEEESEEENEDNGNFEEMEESGKIRHSARLCRNNRKSWQRRKLAQQEEEESDNIEVTLFANNKESSKEDSAEEDKEEAKIEEEEENREETQPQQKARMAREVEGLKKTGFPPPIAKQRRHYTGSYYVPSPDDDSDRSSAYCYYSVVVHDDYDDLDNDNFDDDEEEKEGRDVEAGSPNACDTAEPVPDERTCNIVDLTGLDDDDDGGGVTAIATAVSGGGFSAVKQEPLAGASVVEQGATSEEGDTNAELEDYRSLRSLIMMERRKRDKLYAKQRINGSVSGKRDSEIPEIPINHQNIQGEIKKLRRVLESIRLDNEILLDSFLSDN